MRFIVPCTFLLFATGCEEWDRIFTTKFADQDTDVEEPEPAPLGCADIDGTFVADAMDFQHEGDPSVGEDFGDFPDYTIVFDRRSESFEAVLIRDGEALVSTGGYSIIGERIVFDAPLVDGMGPGPVALRCDYDGHALTLYGPATYQFDGVQPEEADFIAILLAD